MTDYSSEFFFDPGITIKEEPMADSMSTSASVPIPTRRALELDDFQRFGFDLENSQSPLSTTSYTMMDQLQNQEGLESNGDMWSGRSDGLKSEVFIHMDDDDIFQVDKADLIQGPTLAELNANDDTLLGEINFDDFLLPEENTYTTLAQKSINVLNTNTNNNNNPLLLASSCPQRGLMFYREQEPVSFESFTARTPTSVSAFSPTSQTSSSSSLLPSSPLHHTTLQQKHSTLHELLMKRENYTSASPDRHLNHTPTQSATPPNAFLARAFYSTDQVSRLSSSAPTHSGPPDHIWQRREPRQHLLSTGSLVEAGSTSSLSTGGILSPDPQDLSNDEFDSDEDSDAHYEDFSSDDSDDDDDHKKSSKKERFFWQYNVQAKGPKGQRLVMKCKMEDPHVLNEVTDPVFSTDCSVRGIKHSGKARKGDGNDLTPNPRKLFTIGKELHKLSRTINDMTPVSELPFNVRPKSRKEKNKLASRACRLKKKAQHEANKIKLSGLEAEHKRLINGISQVKHVLIAKINDSVQEKEDTGAHLDKLAKSTTKIRIAGHTTEYVNKVLDKIKGNGQAVTMDDL